MEVSVDIKFCSLKAHRITSRKISPPPPWVKDTMLGECERGECTLHLYVTFAPHRASEKYELIRKLNDEVR